MKVAALSAAFTIMSEELQPSFMCVREVLPELCKRYPTSDKIKVHAESVNKTVERNGVVMIWRFTLKTGPKLV